MNAKELRILPALEGQESSDDQPSAAKILSLGNPGISWTTVQELMRVTRGLPVRGPPGTAQAVLRQQARRQGFNLCIRVPPALHRKSTCSKDWHVTEEAEWVHFLSIIPFDEASALSTVKELSRWQLGGWAYAAAMGGWHMLWEVAVSSLTRGLGGIWGANDVRLLVEAMASSLQVVDNPQERVGKATAGACAAAALWWLLSQPRSSLHVTAQASADGSSTQAKDSHEAISAASELYLRSYDPGQETPQSSSGGRLKQTATLLEEGMHPKDLNVVRAAPPPHHMLHCLLQSGLLRLSTAKLKELSLSMLGKQGKAEVLKASFRRDHTAKAAAWSAGALFQALSIPYVQGALVSACVEELLFERGTVKRQQQQQQLQQQVEAPGAVQEKLPTMFGQSKSQSGKSGASHAATPRDKAPQRQTSDKSSRSHNSHQSAEEGSGKALRAGPEFSAAFLQLGVDAPGAFWSSLTAAALLPKWLRAPDHCRIAPLSWIEGLIKIQIKYKARASRRQWAHLREQLRQAGHNARGARALKRALLPGPGLSKEDMEAGRIANRKLAALDTIPIEDFSQYFDTRADNHAGVCAAETLLCLLLVNTFSMAVENDSGVSEAVSPLRAHFLMAADTKMLMQLLGKSLPMRSQHMGVCILSLLFYAPLPDGAPKLSQSQPRVQNLDVHALVPCLKHLVALEKIELVSRYGMGMLNVAAAEASYAHSLQPRGIGGGGAVAGAAGAASATTDMGPHTFGSPAAHHHLPRRASTANVGKGATHPPFPLHGSSHDHRRATIANPSNVELFGISECQPSSNTGTGSTADSTHSRSGNASNSRTIPIASSVGPGFHATARAALKANAAGGAGAQGQFVWPSDGTPIVVSKSAQDGKPLTCADGSLVGGPPGIHNPAAVQGTSQSPGAEAGADASATAGVQGGKGNSGLAQTVMGHHVKVPLRDLRWKSHGSEVSVHAAVCCWGCARIVAKQECSKEQQHHQRLAALRGIITSTLNAYATPANPVQPLQSHMSLQGRAEQKGKDAGALNALGAAVKARASSATLDQQEQTTLLLMQMLAQCLNYPCHGPAAHLLSSAMIAMAHEPAAVPMLLKLGLIDAGDQKGLVSTSAFSTAKPKQAGRGVLSQERWGKELSDAPPRNGIMGIMSKAHHATHARCLIALIACVALANPGPPSGEPPKPAWVFEASPTPGKVTPSENGSDSERAGSVKGNGSEEDEGDSMLTRQGVNGRLRLLRAGVWPLLQTCRDTCGCPMTPEVQQALAIAYMYLGQEVEQSYNKVLEAARQERRAQRASVPARADAGGPAASVTEMGDLDPSGSHSVDGVSEEGASHQSSLPATIPSNQSDESMSDTDSVLEHQGHVNMHPVYTLLLVGKYSTLEEAVKPLCELLSLGINDVESDDPSASLAGIHMYASLAAISLAAVPGLKEPMGEAGAIQALTNIVRRWVDLSLADQRSQKRTAESALAALTHLMQGSECAKNVLRFVASWKTGSKEAVARELMKEFGYPMTSGFDTPPPKTYRSTADLVGGTSWSAWGRGSKHAVVHVRALEQHQPLGASGQWHKHDTVSCPAEVDQMASWPLVQGPNGLHDQDSMARPQGGKLQQDGETTQRSSSRGGLASKKEDKNSANLSDSRSALDPIQVMVQVVAVRTRQKSRYMQLKLHALLALKIVAQVGDIRQRLIESGAGPQMADLAGDPGFDSRTRAAAGSLWLEISHTKEGQWPLWWSCVMQEPGADPPLSMSQLHEKYGDDFTCVTAQMRMCFLMLQSREPETELVGANHSASLLCQGDMAKQRFYEAGGLGALINVASCSTTTLTVLAPVCTALLNLSSFVPIQVEMCNKVLRLMLHINSKYGRLNGYKPAEEDISERESLNSSMSGSHATSVASSVKSRRMRELDNSMTQTVLYCSSGCLWNLSRNPDNRDLLYRVELEVKSRQAMVDVLEEGALPAMPQAGALHFGQPPPTAKGMPVDAHAAALLQDLLAEPLVEEEEHHARLSGRDVGFDMGGRSLSRSPSFGESVADGPTLQRHAIFGGLDPTDLGSKRPSSLSQYRGSRAASHRGFGSGTSSSEGGGSFDAKGGLEVPRLATLQRRLQAPRASMFAPLSVDKHNTAAATLFALRGEQPPKQNIGPPATNAVGTNAAVGNSGAKLCPAGEAAQTGTSTSLAGPRYAEHAESAAEFAISSAQEHDSTTGSGKTQQQLLQQRQQQHQQEQQALWHRVQRQRQQRHRLHHGALSGSTVLRPHTAPNSGPSSRWSPHIGSCTLHPPSRWPLSPADQAAFNTKPAFAKARAAAAAEAAKAEAAAAAAAMPDNEWGLKGSVELGSGSNRLQAQNQNSNSSLQGACQTRYPSNVQTAMQGEGSKGSTVDLCLSFLPGSQHVRVRGLKGALDTHSPKYSPLGSMPDAAGMRTVTAQPFTPHTVAAYSAADRLGTTHTYAANGRSAAPANGAAVAATSLGGGATMSMVEACQGVLQQVGPTFAAPHKPHMRNRHMSREPLASTGHDSAAEQPGTKNVNYLEPTNVSKLALGRDDAQSTEHPSKKPVVFSKTWRGVPEWKLDSKQRALRDFEVPGAAVWPAVEGTALGQSLFTKYTPENGAAQPGRNVQGLYIYRGRKTRVDEIPPPQDPSAHRDFDFGCAISLEGVDELARELLRPWTELPFQPVMPKLEVPRPPMFEHSLLPDLKSLSTLDAVVSPKPSPASGAQGQDMGSGWRLEDSVFAHRPKQCESKEFYDNQRITEKALEQDLSRCMEKKRFQKFLDKWAPREARDELVAELKRRHAELLRIFDWYACLGSGDPFSMQIGAWGQLMTDTDIADDKSKGCKLSDLDRVFLATNLEEDRNKSEADKINLDNSLMRFEFLEGILRVTVVKAFESKPLKPKGKHASRAKDDSKKLAEQKGESGAAGDPSDPKSLPKPATMTEAVSRIFHYHLLPGVPPESLLDNNAWRKERLYNEDVDLLLKANLPVLQSVYDHYATLLAGRDMKLLDLPEWMEMLTEADLFKTCRDFNVRDGKLAFIWSRMRCVDDCKSLKALQRSRALTFEEFLDALCHVADMISPPPVPELLAIGCSEHHTTTDYFMKVCNELGPLRRRDSADVRAPKTRPLDEKLEQVLELLLDNLMARHAARSHAHLMERLKAGRGRGYSLGKGSGM